jgi:methionyl-tRNA formyltransferase
MSVALIARTQWALDAARLLQKAGVEISLVATHRAEPFYNCGIKEYRKFAADSGIPFIDASKISHDALVAQISGGGSVAISVNWPTILPAEVIGRFRLGMLNAHAGDLPRYRGNACPNWAILNGESHVGLCVHLMQPGQLDSGPVLLRDRLQIGDGTYIGDIYRWLDQRIPSMLSEGAIGLISSKLAPLPQPSDPKLALRCYPRRPEDGRINWTRSAEQIHRLVRASSRPFDGAFAFLADGRRVTIWRADMFAHPGPFCAVPGQVILRENGVPIVSCGEGCLALTELEISGMIAADAIKTVGSSLRARLS